MAILPNSSSKARTKKEEGPLFVGITSGNELRKDILECSKGILEALKEYENFKDAREEKTRLIHKFKNDVKDISKLINALRNRLPKVKEIGIERPAVKKGRESGPKMVKVEKPKVKTELEKLEVELSEIESKLDSLS